MRLETIAAGPSGGRLVALPEATHWLHHEAPRRVNAALLEALG